MRNSLHFILVLSIAVLAGCTGSKGSKTATVELEGNPTTGYEWVYEIVPEGIVKEVSHDYKTDRSGNVNADGAGGTFSFVFEAVAAGEAEITFSYRRPWEEGVEPVYTVVYTAVADDKLNLTLTEQ